MIPCSSANERVWYVRLILPYVWIWARLGGQREEEKVIRKYYISFQTFWETQIVVGDTYKCDQWHDLTIGIFEWMALLHQPNNNH